MTYYRTTAIEGLKIFYREVNKKQAIDIGYHTFRVRLDDISKLVSSSLPEKKTNRT
jgi:hypothetical protein